MVPISRRRATSGAIGEACGQLCEVLLESFPPQCGGLRLVVENLDLGTIVGLQTATRESVPVTWSNQPMQLLGTVSDGVLTVSDTVRS